MWRHATTLPPPTDPSNQTIPYRVTQVNHIEKVDVIRSTSHQLELNALSVTSQPNRPVIHHSSMTRPHSSLFEESKKWTLLSRRFPIEWTVSDGCNLNHDRVTNERTPSSLLTLNMVSHWVNRRYLEAQWNEGTDELDWNVTASEKWSKRRGSGGSAAVEKRGRSHLKQKTPPLLMEDIKLYCDRRVSLSFIGLPLTLNQ